ncbi:lipopolysaccharide export system permease protein [Prosthecobacter fusiformis]|uniref:Lipopolysaccharide export system permease protein n=1 Tax=Prosthecobacter fusiformis TaxID=48464 RepID=A0A4R7RQW8_9BACT|nr:LptF/LptG family permease [Prosthecobacter fusiformis]TDU67185.1 lipopolysaccharide export system permease protein [Prosthecobacter fusiformis]
MVVRIFDRYLGKQVLSATLMGVLLLSGVMVLGNVYKKLDELLGDTQLPLGFILEFIALIIPFSLIFTIPWAFLTGILLVFGRLSADNELVSLRMTGWSMARICAAVFVLAFAFSSVCYWVNVSVSPMAKDRIKRMFFEVAMENPAALFQEGRVLDKVPGFRIYTGKRDGNILKDVEIIEMEDRLAQRVIHARRAVLEMKPGELDFVMHLEGAEIESITYTDEKAVDKVEFVNAESTAIVFPLSRLKADTVKVNASMKATSMLWEEVSSHQDGVTGKAMDAKDHSRSLTELSKRYSFSLACITFALVGIPLGVTAQRRETSSGFALSLITATVYLVFIILGDTLNSQPSALPHLIMWLPNVLFLGIGGFLFYRLSRR